MTPRRLEGGRIVVATHNKGKLAEIRDLLAPHGIDAVSAGELDLPEPEETGETFEANAALKALSAALASGLPALADDSGLCVAALGGQPGIFSARWAGEDKDFARAMRNIEEMLAQSGSSDRAAHFVAALCLAWPDGHTETVRGEVHGTLVWPPRGDAGFGYDPIFVAEGRTVTNAELSPAAKDAISHRGKAVRAMVDHLRRLNEGATA